MPNVGRLSRKQKYALILLEYVRTPGVVTSGSTALLDGQAWVNWQTAQSLHERELATVRGEGEATEIVLGIASRRERRDG